MKIPSTLLSFTLAFSLVAHTEPATSDSLCASQVLAPAQYRPSTESVTVYESSTAYATTPPQIGYGERKVKIADDYVTYAIIPATFGEVTETIEVERERVEIETLPATYRTETKRVKVKAASQRWNPICPQVLSALSPDANPVPANCLIEIPAEYTTVTREVIDMPARTVKKVIPARTTTITRKVVLKPAEVIRKETPAVYTSVKLAKVDQPAKVITSLNAAKVQDIPAQQKTRPAQVVQMPALCEASITPEKILPLQGRLQQLGYYEGTPDGILGPKTRAATTRFQEDNALASGAITLETLRKLQLQ